MRFKIIEKENNIELTNNGLITSAINSNLYYKSGDAIERMYHLWIGGVLTGGNKEIWITIPLNKPILAISQSTIFA